MEALTAADPGQNQPLTFLGPVEVDATGLLLHERRGGGIEHVDVAGELVVGIGRYGLLEPQTLDGGVEPKHALEEVYPKGLCLLGLIAAAGQSCYKCLRAALGARDRAPLPASGFSV